MILDANVLVAVHRQDHPAFTEVRPWFDTLAHDERRFGVPDPVWASFVRITTNRRIFEVPSPLTDAFAFLWAVRAQPHHVGVIPGPHHLGLFERLCHDGEVTGDLVADAYLAAIALELDASWFLSTVTLPGSRGSSGVGPSWSEVTADDAGDPEAGKEQRSAGPSASSLAQATVKP